MSKPAQSIAFKLTALTVYGLAIASSSFLMFCVEPFVAQLLLPSLGGGPNVWTSCMLFFQVILLAAYIYAHLISTHLSPRTQILAHLVVVWLPAGCLPIQRPFAPPMEVHPYLWAFFSLATMCGALFFAVSATAPLMQKWYSKIEAAGSADPYFLYSMSNLGGVLGLVSYSLLVAPNMGLVSQNRILSILYVSLATLITICGVFLWISTKQFEKTERSADVEKVVQTEPMVDSTKAHETANQSASIQVEEGANKTTNGDTAQSIDSRLGSPIKTRTVVYWLTMTMIPSSLVLGLTSYVTSEVSSLPLFWAVPLFLYLLSFIIAFGRCPVFVLKWIRFLAPLAVAFAAIFLTSPTLSAAVYGANGTVVTGLSIHLIALFLVCTACHGAVAMDRPSSTHLTFYYLIISIGGVLGSCFNTLAAPILFKGGEEYPIVLLMAGVILSGLPHIRLPAFASFGNKLGFWMARSQGRADLMTFVVPTIVFLVASFSWYWHGANSHAEQAMTAGGRALLKETVFEFCLRFVLPYVCCFILARTVTQYRFGLVVISSFLLYSYALADPLVIFRDRNFFGFVSVKLNKDYNCSEIWNDLSLHGMESLDPAERGEPFLYMSPDGPVGQIYETIFGQSSSPISAMEAIEPSDDQKRKAGSAKQTALAPIGVIGIGCGTAAYLAKPGQQLVFYEINKKVIEIADNPFYFSYLYLARKRNVDLKIVCGDGRLEIQKAPYNFFKLIISDAYSGSSIPTHLITLEAIRMYLQKLTPDGVIVFNINNQYYDLWPVFESAASQLGVHALLVREYYFASEDTYTDWVVITKNEKVIELMKDKVQKPKPLDSKFRLWTDDFSNPLSLFCPDKLS